MPYFPMMVDLHDRQVLVIGGGEEGRKKVEILHGFGAAVTLIAVDAKKEAVDLAEKFEKREFQDIDISDEYALIVAATDDRRLNERISILAGKKRIPVNIVDDAEFCTFIFPAIIKKADVVCSVSSAGKSPYVAQYVKNLVENVLPPEIGEINDRMGEYRIQAKREIEEAADRRVFLKKKLEELLGGP